MAKSKQNPTTGLYTYGSNSAYDPSKETDLNKFNDWAQKNPNSAAKYGAREGTYNGSGADLTPGSGAAANNYTGTRLGNTANTANTANTGNGFKAPANFDINANPRTMEDNWSTQDYMGVDGGKMRVSYDNMGNYTTENFDTGDLSGYDVGSQTNYAAGNSGDAYAITRDGGATGESSGLGGIFDVKGAGGSVFSNTASGLGSLAGMYYGYKGIGAAKDALNFQKEQYADQKAQQARANKKQEDFGLALASAMPAKNLPVNKVG